jgi:single-stranded-DNA-specific exonuclease
MPELIRRRSQQAIPAALQQIHPVLARVLASRGIEKVEDTELSLDKLLPPASLAGLQAAAFLLADALKQGESIMIVGDFDADGATSTAVAVSALQSMGAKSVNFLVPNRFEYGYGLTPEIVELASQSRPDVIVTVDNGISSIEGVARANELGIRVVITDHHLPGNELPQADVIVNPNQAGCEFESKNLAGVGVIFYLMTALRSELRQRDWFAASGIVEPRLAELLDLVALGTVADVVPLDRNNRILVQQGLLRMRAGKARPGIQALLDIAKRPAHRLVAGDLAFAVAPRLNAAGRLDDMSVGIACLLAPDAQSARNYAEQLDGLNRDRQLIERDMQTEALQILDQFFESNGDELPSAFCLYDPRWHQGVVGILASRIKQRLHRPTIAFADGEGDTIKGSARSIPGLHIRDALDRVATRHTGLIDKFGGHAMAAGLSLPRDNLEVFRESFEFEVAQLLDNVELDAVVESDGELPCTDLGLALAQQLRYASPWGQNFPEPVFDDIFQIVHQRLVGERHLKLVLSHPDDPATLFDAIAFNVDLDHWPDESIETARIAFRLDLNYFRGEERLQLMVEQIKAESKA